MDERGRQRRVVRKIRGFHFPQHRSGYVVRDSDVVHRQRAQSELFEKLSEPVFFL